MYLLHEKIDRFWRSVPRRSVQGRVVETLYSQWLIASYGEEKSRLYNLIEEHMDVVKSIQRNITA